MTLKSNVTCEALERVMSRREAARLAAAAGVAAVTLPIAVRPASAEGEVTFFTWAGYDIPEIIPSYDGVPLRGVAGGFGCRALRRGRVCQRATAGRLTRGSSLSGAIVSSVM